MVEAVEEAGEAGAQPGSRNIVLLFDGTSNQIGADRTNILRLYGALARTGSQIVFYDPGVGTMGMSRTWTYFSEKVYEFLGLAIGVGLDDNVIEGYRFLMRHWRPGDKVYLFGFSRGAYTARVLAGFLCGFGMIAAEQENVLLYAYRAYKRVVGGPQTAKQRFMPLRLHEQSLLPRQDFPIEFLGLFDTVSTVAIIRDGLPQFANLPWTRNNHKVRRVRHAVAIDERRRFFRDYRWDRGQKHLPGRNVPAREEFEQAPPQDFAELWFAGSHGDVGGGWPEERSGLAKIALNWMMDQVDKDRIADGGLDFADSRTKPFLIGDGLYPARYSRPDAQAPANNEMIWVWPWLEWLPKFSRTGPWWRRFLPPRGERRALPEDAALHDSVYWKLAFTEYDPPNLPPGTKARARAMYKR